FKLQKDSQSQSPSYLGEPDQALQKNQLENFPEIRHVGDAQGPLESRPHHSVSFGKPVKIYTSLGFPPKVTDSIKSNQAIKGNQRRTLANRLVSSTQLAKLSNVPNFNPTHRTHAFGYSDFPDLAKIGHLMNFALKNDINRSVIGQIT
ncbi:hypothetical protein H5410_060998, partial [Solanum commersonii]